MDDVRLWYSDDQKIAFLKRHGCEVRPEQVEMSWSCYHNEVESDFREVLAVYRDGVAFEKPMMSNYTSSRWVDDAFSRLLRERLLLV